MDCQSVMRITETRLFADAPLSEAIDFMVAHHMGRVPVVDREEVFVGLLNGDRLMNALLPHTLTMMRGFRRAGFLRESREELEERLADLREKPVADLMDHKVEVVHPQTPLADALYYLSNRQAVIPVVGRDDGRLLGAISALSVMRALLGEPA